MLQLDFYRPRSGSTKTMTIVGATLEATIAKAIDFQQNEVVNYGNSGSNYVVVEVP